jgi:hypothetical protein
MVLGSEFILFVSEKLINVDEIALLHALEIVFEFSTIDTTTSSLFGTE